MLQSRKSDWNKKRQQHLQEIVCSNNTCATTMPKKNQNHDETKRSHSRFVENLTEAQNTLMLNST